MTDFEFIDCDADVVAMSPLPLNLMDGEWTWKAPPGLNDDGDGDETTSS